MVYIAKEAWPEKKDFLQEDDKRRVTVRASRQELAELTAPTGYTPGLLYQLGVGLLAGNGGHVASRRALDGRVGDVADGQEVGSEPPNAQLGHVGE